MQHAEQTVFKTPRIESALFDFTGRWINELGSTMDIVINQTVVTGKYISAVSDLGGPTPPYDMFGSVHGELITFGVNWGTEITTWIGHLVNKDTHSEILTLWHVVKTLPNDDDNDPENQWKMILSGSDRFERTRPDD